MTGYYDWRNNWRNNGKMYCSRVIATAEKSAGNETVGDKWVETASFPAETTIQEIMDWAGNHGISGKLYITPDLSTEKGEDE